MRAYELLADPAKWIKGMSALNHAGFVVEANNDTACRWCLLGAIRHCYGYTHSTDVLIGRIESHIHEIVTRWNDHPERSHAEVVGLLKELDI